MKLIEIVAGIYWNIRQAWREKRVTLEINLGELLFWVLLVVLILKKD
ncbi:hypothetical protein [Cupriavidus necator]|nr:hypothetical protein [Cupriavidus necator]